MRNAKVRRNMRCPTVEREKIKTSIKTEKAPGFSYSASFNLHKETTEERTNRFVAEMLSLFSSGDIFTFQAFKKPV